MGRRATLTAEERTEHRRQVQRAQRMKRKKSSKKEMSNCERIKAEMQETYEHGKWEALHAEFRVEAVAENIVKRTRKRREHVDELREKINLELLEEKQRAAEDEAWKLRISEPRLSSSYEESSVSWEKVKARLAKLRPDCEQLSINHSAHLVAAGDLAKEENSDALQEIAVNENDLEKRRKELVRTCSAEKKLIREKAKEEIAKVEERHKAELDEIEKKRTVLDLERRKLSDRVTAAVEEAKQASENAKSRRLRLFERLLKEEIVCAKEHHFWLDWKWRSDRHTKRVNMMAKRRRNIDLFVLNQKRDISQMRSSQREEKQMLEYDAACLRNRNADPERHDLLIKRQIQDAERETALAGNAPIGIMDYETLQLFQLKKKREADQRHDTAALADPAFDPKHREWLLAFQKIDGHRGMLDLFYRTNRRCAFMEERHQRDLWEHRNRQNESADESP